jgi:hypothetical protein
MYKLMDRKSDASYLERGQRASALERLRAAAALGDAS